MSDSGLYYLTNEKPENKFFFTFYGKLAYLNVVS